MPTIKALTVDFDLITQSMRDLARETSEYFLDVTSGKVMSLSRRLIRALSSGSAEDRLSLPEWDARMIPVAREIILEGSPRYVRIPEALGVPEHRWMSGFTETVTSPKLKNHLLAALRGRGACRRFNELLKDHPEERQRWRQYRAQCWKLKIQSWLEAIGILAVEEKPGRPAAAA